MAQQLLGLPVAKALTERVASRVKALANQGVVPTLAIVRVGEREDDLAYERGAMKRCDAAGIAVRSFVLPSTCGDAELLDVIGRINEDAGIHGCLLFRPLPRSLVRPACSSPRAVTAAPTRRLLRRRRRRRKAVMPSRRRRPKRQR